MYKSLLIILGIIYLAPNGFSKKKIGHLPEPSKKDTETILRIQIFLDEKMYGPGKIDGRMGQFTRKAVAHYNFGYDLQYDNYYKVINESNAVVDQLFTTYTIKEEDYKFVGEVPFEPSEQAEIDYLYYRSILEFAAERFHSDEKYLTKINPETDWEKVVAGTIIRVPNVTSFKIEDVRKDKSFLRERKLSKRLVIVDTSQKLVTIWDKKKILAAFPITPGQEKFIHRGNWVIQNMITTPTFRWDQSMLDTGKRSNEAHLLPPGPNSPIGIFWAGLNKGGIGLHGTSSPHTIGRSRSAGCVRLANWDVVRLSDLVRPGAKVEMR